MRNILLYIVLTAAALMIPVKRTDVASLIPVESVYLYIEEEMIVVETDTGDRGRGKTVEEAVENIHETSSGIVYLDTAEFLLVGSGAESCLDEMGRYLKPTIRVCKAISVVNIRELTKYLMIHKPEQTLEMAISHGIAKNVEQNKA